ncbi:MAG: MarR family transcriptional regulator [Calditrichaeota bacterium]|nr:MarR family transcriptional regulator [Calditrichota bacterium]
MREEAILEKMKFIFGSIFLIAHKWQHKGDQYLAEDNLTTKQWLLLTVIVKFFDSPPTLGQAAKAMGTSRQNVKQIALKLEKRGFVKIKKDEKDSRILRLEVTEKSHRFWENRADRDKEYILGLFENLSDADIEMLSQALKKIMVK